MNPLILPQINLNGTSARALVEQQIEVLRAFDELQKAMADAAPHGRDYQLRAAEFAPARAAWMERQQVIFAMRKEIEQHAEKIQDQAT